MTEPISIFVSYSHKDEGLRDELAAHLAILRHQALISDWHDRRIAPGAKWSKEIDDHLDESQIILMLVSADFLASEYCYNIEMLQALKRHDSGDARVIPVIIRPVDWTGSPLAELQTLPQDARPVTSWTNRDEAWVDVCRRLRTVCEELRYWRSQPPPPDGSEKEQLPTLLERFLRTWNTWYFNAPRIRNWGSKQPGFEYLRTFSVEQINEELGRLTSSGAIKTRKSSSGSPLYKIP